MTSDELAELRADVRPEADDGGDVVNPLWEDPGGDPAAAGRVDPAVLIEQEAAEDLLLRTARTEVTDEERTELLRELDTALDHSDSEPDDPAES